jgi:F-type H+/Na+-transporting ATPase subunit alpha
VAGSLKLELAQYRELAAFAQFGSDLDKATQAQLNRGQRLVEILKQPQFQPLGFGRQITIIFAGTNGYIDDLPIDQVRDFETELYKYLDAINPNLTKNIEEKKTLDDAIKADLKKTLDDFKKTFVSSRQAVGATA